MSRASMQEKPLWVCSSIESGAPIWEDFLVYILLACLRPDPGRHAADPDSVQLYPDEYRHVSRLSCCQSARVSH